MGVCVGIDFGELEMRVAYAQHGSPALLEVQVDPREPGILFDPYRNISSLGVGFPSILQRVGTGTPFSYEDGARNDTPESVVQRRLALIREGVTAASGDPPGPTVIAVPASLSERKRQALLDCAKRAGLAEASLIDRSIAVALGIRSDKDQSGTFVVYSLDYGDCEYSLARLGLGRCWIVGSALAPRVSGERLDAMVMEDLILALRDRQIFLGLKRFTPIHWHNFRQIAESIRHKLAQHAIVEVSLDPKVTGSDTTVVVRLNARQYALAVKRYLSETFDNINALLENNGLESVNIDAALLVGEHATALPVANIVWDAFPGKVSRTDVNVIAFGALVCASDAAGRQLAPSSRSGFASPADLRGLGSTAGTDGSADESPGGSSQFAEVLRVEGGATGPPAAAAQPRAIGTGDRINEARLLKHQGRYGEAELLLAALSQEIAEIREQLQSSTPSWAQQLIQQARALVIDGRYPESVALAHQAYSEAPQDPVVFTGMMKIHADAGLGLNQPDQYDAAIKILSCAHGHDQTDRTIHKAFAERHHMQAVAMLKLNNPERALEATRSALTFDPKHGQANELLAELLRPDETPT